MESRVEHRFEHVDAQSPLLDRAATDGTVALAFYEDVGGFVR